MGDHERTMTAIYTVKPALTLLPKCDRVKMLNIAEQQQNTALHLAVLALNMEDCD